MKFVILPLLNYVGKGKIIFNEINHYGNKAIGVIECQQGAPYHYLALDFDSTRN